MCGIIGQFSYVMKDVELVDPLVKSLVQRALFSEILAALEVRGKDATGISLLWQDSAAAVMKQPIHSSFFTRNDGDYTEEFTNPKEERANYSWLMKNWFRSRDVELKQALGHVRAKTQGSELNPHNNHPIIIMDGKLKEDGETNTLSKSSIIGVHNGGIKNDTALFNKYKFDRIAQVDSEIIFHLINRYKDDFTIDNATKVFDDLSGVFAVLAHNTDNPSLVMGLRDTRPMVGAFIKELGTLLIVSEKKYIEHALEVYERWRVRESNSNYAYVHEDGTEEDLGLVEENFPYLRVDFMDPVPEGVFILDLEEEVDSDTKASDLIDVEKMSKPSTYCNTGYSNSHYYNSSTGTKTTDKRSSVQTSADKKPTAEKNTETVTVEDSTDYSENPDDLIGAELIEMPLDAVCDDDSYDPDECGYSYEELCAMGSNYLNTAEADENKNLLINSDIETKMSVLKDACLSAPKEKVDRFTEICFDVAFPHGFAVGVSEGFQMAAIEFESLAVSDKDEKELELEKELQEKEDELTQAVNALKTSRDKHLKSTRLNKNMSNFVRLLLLKLGAVNKDFSLNKRKITKLMSDFGKMDFSKVCLSDLNTKLKGTA